MCNKDIINEEVKKFLSSMVETDPNLITSEIKKEFLLRNAIATVNDIVESGSDGAKIYVFDTVDISDRDSVLSKFTCFRANNQVEKITCKSAYKDNNNSIYVGKVENGIRTRLTKHIGLSEKTNTWALKLAKVMGLDCDIKFTLTIYSLDLNPKKSIKDRILVSVFESVVKEQKRPMLGR